MSSEQAVQHNSCHACDLSCIVTFHEEKYLAYRTLSSIHQCRLYAETRGCSVEFVLVLDCADELTTEVVTTHPDVRESDVIIQVANGDPGLSRNDGARAAHGIYVSIHDGDDYFSENYLFECVERCRSKSNSVVHAGTIIEFESKYCFYKVPSYEKHEYSRFDFFKQHPLMGTYVAERSTLLEHPYLSNSNGFGYEDWHWNAETFAEGFVHIPVEGTYLFYRKKKKSSTLAVHHAQKSLIRPTKLYDQLESTVIAAQQNAANVEPSLLASLGNRFYQRAKMSTKKLISKLPEELQSPALSAARALLSFFRLFAIYRKNKQLEKNTSIESAPLAPSVYAECLQALTQISTLDSTLHPSVNQPLYEYKYTSDEALGLLFAQLYNPIKGIHYDGVYLVPWLKRGGADLMTLNFATILSEQNLKLLVIQTLSAESPWRQKLPASVDFMDLGLHVHNLVKEDQVFLLARLLLQIRPYFVHCFNSELGLDTFLTYGHALKEYMKLYVAFYCDDKLQDGTDYGYVSRYLTALAPVITKFSTDNSILPKVWQKKYGVPALLFQTVYGFVPEEEENRTPLSERGNGVLWAGRFDYQKRPDLLLDIATQMPDTQFYVYGTPSLDDTLKIYDRLKELPNVYLGGSYDGFSSLPVEKCRCFLYTSAYDGLPNVLLEAGNAGLVILSTDFCGIRDFIINGETGWILPENAAYVNYITALRSVIANEKISQKMVTDIHKMIEKKFIKSISSQALGSCHFNNNYT